MGDLLDLFLDFERKLLALIKDLALHPKKVADSIVAKDKHYLGAFKFYTLATSAWLIFFQFGNRYFDFFSDDFVLPERLTKYLHSEQDFAFLIAPFAGLAEFFIPFAFINWLLFRKRELSWLNHITLNIYLAGFLLVYVLPWFLILYVIGTFTRFDGEVINYLAYLFTMIAPVVYYCWVHMKVFGVKKIVSFSKPFITVIAISYLSISLLLNEPFHELIHRKIFFSKYNQFTLEPTADTLSYSYTFSDTLFDETSTHNRFPANVVKGVTSHVNTSILANYDRNTMQYLYSLIITTPEITRNIPLPQQVVNEEQFFSINEIDSGSQFIVLQNNWLTAFSDALRLIKVDQKGVPSNPKIFTDHLSVLSKIIEVDSSLVFSGILRASKEPVLGKLNPALDATQEVYTFHNQKNYYIDFLSPTSSSAFELLMSHDDGGKLKEIIWMQGSLTAKGFKKTAEIGLYKNEFSPTKNFFAGFLHNSKLAYLNDTTSVAAFQIMTDSSFAISLSRINTRQMKVEWNSIFSIPADFAFNDELLADSTSVYLLGRAAAIFHPGLSLYYYQLPYVQKVNIQTSISEGIHFLPMNKSWTGYYLSIPENIYTVSSSAYQDDQYIYWWIACNGGSHYYKIKKSEL